MDWMRLLSAKRLGKSQTGNSSPSPRTEFTRDYDRIIFSAAFRRLQDKTQVFPLAKSDYVRTRLTHSLEVASVGRSLGMLAADVIARKQTDLQMPGLPHDVGTIVATACLAHDIGNPPFGHAGESAIQEWFATSTVAEELSGSQWFDLRKFEGNAHGFRTLCTLQRASENNGLQLTCAVLGAFTKYPRESDAEESQREGISGKKFGFMQSEATQFVELAEELGLVRKAGKALAWHRHPLAFLVEAADDICYHVMDVEDGFRAGLLTFEEIETLHSPWLEDRHRRIAGQMQQPARQVEYYRAVTLDAMVRDVVGAFEDHYDGLMSGAFDTELTANIERSAKFKEFKELAKRKVYSARQVIEVEACGFEVIAGLLEAFVTALRKRATGSESGAARTRTILGLMSKTTGDVDLTELTPYQRTLLATDFVAGMTDSFAVQLYQRIRGISLP